MKYIKYIIFCLTIVFSLVSCTSSENSEKDFQIGYTNTTMEMHHGCVRHYTYDTISKNKYDAVLFIADLVENRASMNINGKEIILKRDTLDTSNIWIANSYTVQINTHVTEELEEFSYVEGTLTIKNGNKVKVIKVRGSEAG
ncbi:MAG: hypothetical protein KF900_06855 [Bacteroidetes bacterium]|nr:hypothetical protein [Bacteroidota bacterium]